MMFTGTLIDDLIATVDRVQQRTLTEAETIAELEAWFMSGQDDASFHNDLRGVA